MLVGRPESMAIKEIRLSGDKAQRLRGLVVSVTTAFS